MQTPTYLKTHYSTDEYSVNAYPQQLCDYLIDQILSPKIGDIGDRSILDVGCGKGNHLLGYARRGLNVFGLDQLDYTNETINAFDIRQCNVENERFPFKSDSLDIVYSKSVIEHIANTDHFLSEIYRVVKPGGLILLMCPDWKTQGYMYYDDYTHVKPWTRKGLQNALKIHKFENIDCDYFRQLPFLWRHPYLTFLADLTCLVPNSWKWRDREETQHRKWIRFSKEKMLLATATKPLRLAR